MTAAGRRAGSGRLVSVGGFEIRTRRLIVRPPALADAPRIRELAGDRDVALATRDVPYPYDVGMAEEWIRSTADGRREGDLLNAVLEHPRHGLVGAVGLVVDRGAAEAELGYWVGRPFWGRGFAAEGAAALVAHAFSVHGLERIHAHHLAGNPASGRVMEKIGMRRVGTAGTEIPRHGGAPEEVIVFAIDREGWADLEGS